MCTPRYTAAARLQRWAAERYEQTVVHTNVRNNKDIKTR